MLRSTRALGQARQAPMRSERGAATVGEDDSGSGQRVIVQGKE